MGNTQINTVRTNNRKMPPDKLPEPGFSFHGSHVYFFQIDNPDGFIKIGKAWHPPSRKKDIECSCPYPIKILGIMDKSKYDIERKLHYLFREHHVKGEWFKPHDDILNYINLHCNNKISEENR